MTEASVKIDRRTRKPERREGDRRKEELAVSVDRRSQDRRDKVQRRRQIDPTTCERDYTQDEIEFMQALDDYKRAAGRQFPTCSEILEVIRGLGYQKPEHADAAGTDVTEEFEPTEESELLEEESLTV